MRSVKEECLDRMILFGEGHLRRVIDQYVEHYHGERNHQGIDNELIAGSPTRWGRPPAASGSAVYSSTNRAA